MNDVIRGAKPEDHAGWVRMRRTVWDVCPEEQQVREMREILGSEIEIALVAERPGGWLCGFVEVSIRP